MVPMEAASCLAGQHADLETVENLQYLLVARQNEVAVKWTIGQRYFLWPLVLLELICLHGVMAEEWAEQADPGVGKSAGSCLVKGARLQTARYGPRVCLVHWILEGFP